MRKKRVSVPSDQIPAMIQAYLTGAHSTELAARYGMSQPAIAYQLRRHGIRLRSKTETNRMRAPVDAAELTRLTEAAELSQAAIARHFGVSQATIERALRALGLRSVRGRGSPMEANFFWNGGRRIDEDRYVMVKAPKHPYATADGYVREHRLVMERVLGRYLRPEEVVHHKRGRSNHPDNLEVFASQADHMRHEWATNWHPRMVALLNRQAQRQFAQRRRRSSPNRPASGTDAVQSP